MEHKMSIPPKVTDDEMKYFQFKARQLFLLRKEDHDWDEYCKKNSCSCKENVSHKVKKEVGIQSSPKKTFYNTRSRNISMDQIRGNLPQALNEIRNKLEKIDLTLSGLMEPIKNENVIDQKVNMLKLPVDNDAPESVRSLINEKKMKLIQNSLKMSLQRLQSSMSKRNPVPTINEKKKSSGYFIPHDLEKQRTTARRLYLASLGKAANKPGSLLTIVKKNGDGKKISFKSKFPKTVTKSRKIMDMDNQKELKIGLITSEAAIETKDENIENIVDAVVDDLMGETVLVINKIKHMKSKKSSAETKKEYKGKSNWEKIRHLLNVETHFSQEQDQAEIENRLQASNVNEIREQITAPKYLSQHYNNQLESLINSTHMTWKELSIDRKVAEDTLKSREKYWDYLEKISRTKRGNFDPWILSNLIAESLLDDCILEISHELQDVPASLISELYDQEFVQSI
ncbi:uncharacterized protein TNCT_604871 [Trichonephila clavata]|uniref:DUF4378 domain-containing protein n=1 Tax=Trichonephila clavata TaxID=2740835 RepID=A0A8X6G3H3_TRICU|nr:uncharacterized protein TNCT_604871 [Trichonephila clavata]